MQDDKFLEALEVVRKTTGYGAHRLARRLGLSPDMVKSLLCRRRRPGKYTAVSVYGGCLEWLEDGPSATVRQALALLMNVVENLGV